MDVKDLKGKAEEELIMEGGAETTEDYSSADQAAANDGSGNIEEDEKPAAPIPMPAVGHTLDFPRKDTAYKKKESLPFDECYSNVWKNRPRNDGAERVAKWLAFVLAGIAIGITAFGMDQLEDALVSHNRTLLQYIIDKYTASSPTNAGLTFWLPIISFSLVCALLGTLAGLLTTYYGPGASGSGVAELIGYMNGINYPDFIGVNTQITKILGVTMAVASRLCIGKEGPLAHIGAIWGAAACYCPGLGFEFLRNDEFKRQIIAAGASAGVSAAFGAPIGGTLFAYEMSKPTVFWTFEMIWKTFTCCSVAVLVLAILQTLASGNVTDGFRGSTIKFGNQLADDKYENSYQVIPAALVIGVVGGLLGALFINVNTRMNALRKRLLTTNWIKPVETAIWSFATGFIFILAPYLIWSGDSSICAKNSELGSVSSDITYRGWCAEDEFDPNASIFWAAEGDIIKNIINDAVPVKAINQFYFLLIWYALTITTYGTNVPAGLFLPGMIIGCAMGRTLFSGSDAAGLIFVSDQLSADEQATQRQALTRSYIILACGGFMAGYTRMTYSLAVILMETSQDIEIFTPMIITIAVANQVGYFCTRSLYERATRGKQMPMLKDSIPPPCETVIASQIMSKSVVTLQNVDTVQNVLEACKTSHHAFPILNSRGNVVGLLPKNYALTLLDSRAFYRVDGLVDEDDDDVRDRTRSVGGTRASGSGGVGYKKL